jgi:hypothetical protein
LKLYGLISPKEVVSHDSIICSGRIKISHLSLKDTECDKGKVLVYDDLNMQSYMYTVARGYVLYLEQKEHALDLEA